MYFFSATDPNYRIKGSRDPLGFQSLWANAGRRAVAHLSTVSVSLRDFMILSYARYFYGQADEQYFMNFFLKFEQVCAYARFSYLPSEGFNGIDFVRKKCDEKSFNFSLRPSDTLLSNQRNYGIYGKYIRPFRDMGLVRDSDFNGVMEHSLTKTDKKAVMGIVNQLLSEEIISLTKEQMEPVAKLLGTITGQERELYRNYILKTPESNHPQDNLFELVTYRPEIAQNEFNLHTVIQVLKQQSAIREELNTALENIQFTDRVLLPLNRFFLHLLGQPSWSFRQIEDDDFGKKLPGSVDYHFADDTLNELNKLLKRPGCDLVDAILQRNESVKTGGNSWIVKEKQRYKVVYGENGQKQRDIKFETAYEFSYFLNTWLSLYRQIELEKWNNTLS